MSRKMLRLMYLQTNGRCDGVVENTSRSKYVLLVKAHILRQSDICMK